jgi:hypothetical protein
MATPGLRLEVVQVVVRVLARRPDRSSTMVDSRRNARPVLEQFFAGSGGSGERGGRMSSSPDIAGRVASHWTHR